MTSSIVLFLQLVVTIGLCSSNHGFKTKNSGVLGLLMMLNEMTLAKLPWTTRIGSDSSTISHDVMWHPSMNLTDNKVRSLCNLIL